MKENCLPACKPGLIRLLFTCLLFALFTTADAQITITGSVLDAEKTPLNGASVRVKGTTKVATANSSGNFSINAGAKDVLIVSFVGFVTIEVPISGRKNLTVSMTREDAKDLEAVVVTALGIKRQARKLGYAASTIKVDEITQNRTTNVMTSLEGKIAGLEIAPPTAGVGASNRIRLRGQAGFNGQTNSPLIVINGLPMDQGARRAEGGGPAVDQGDNLQQVNPDDIETMTVLKGATAAALYGSRASNGAIIITTKSGAKNSKFGVEFTSNFTAAQALDYSDYQTEYGTGSNGVRPSSQAQAQAFGNLAWGEKYDGVPTIQYDGVSRPYSPDKNRMKEFYRTGTTLTNTIL